MDLAQATPESDVRQVAEGAAQHLHDDAWFHSTAGFQEVTSELSRRFRSALGPDHPLPCGFLGHVVTELLLDAALIEREPSRLGDYYDRLAGVDPQRVEVAVNQMARGATQRLSRFIPLFVMDRFLYDYARDESLLARLNRVLHRVKLTPLPATALDVLQAARPYVRARWNDLLPVDRYPFAASL